MLGTVRDSCKIHPMVHDYRMSEAIENLSDLISDHSDGAELFARNYVTQGMDTLFREGRLQTENLGRRIERDARQIALPKLQQAMINRVTGLFHAQSRSKAAYQEVQIMPRLDDVRLAGSRVLLVLQPDARTRPDAIRNFFDFQQQEKKNNCLILSGHTSHLANEVVTWQRELYAVELPTRTGGSPCVMRSATRPKTS